MGNSESIPTVHLNQLENLVRRLPQQTKSKIILLWDTEINGKPVTVPWEFDIILANQKLDISHDCLDIKLDLQERVCKLESLAYMVDDVTQCPGYSSKGGRSYSSRVLKLVDDINRIMSMSKCELFDASTRVDQKNHTPGSDDSQANYLNLARGYTLYEGNGYVEKVPGNNIAEVVQAANRSLRKRYDRLTRREYIQKLQRKFKMKLDKKKADFNAFFSEYYGKRMERVESLLTGEYIIQEFEHVTTEYNFDTSQQLSFILKGNLVTGSLEPETFNQVIGVHNDSIFNDVEEQPLIELLRSIKSGQIDEKTGYFIITTPAKIYTVAPFRAGPDDHQALMIFQNVLACSPSFREKEMEITTLSTVVAFLNLKTECENMRCVMMEMINTYQISPKLYRHAVDMIYTALVPYLSEKFVSYVKYYENESGPIEMTLTTSGKPPQFVITPLVPETSRGAP
jgi:hypothetical protein